MIGVQELRKGMTYIDDDGNLYKVLEYSHVKMGRGNATVKVKVRNVRTGSNVDKSFQTGGRIQDVHLDTNKVQYLYTDGDMFHFMDNETYDQPALSKELLGEQALYLKEGITCELSTYEGSPIDIALPTTVDLQVTETAPNVKGDTASGGGKPATLETGLVVNVPFFVSAGDTVRINTESGNYVTRV